MYYTNGNYEAFAHPRKPQGVDAKSAWLIGSGLASLSAAAFLIPINIFCAVIEYHAENGKGS